jgi:hypothetical protein
MSLAMRISAAIPTCEGAEDSMGIVVRAANRWEPESRQL